MAKLMEERIHLATVCEGDKGIRTDLTLVYMNCFYKVHSTTGYYYHEIGIKILALVMRMKQ